MLCWICAYFGYFFRIWTQSKRKSESSSCRGPLKSLFLDSLAKFDPRKVSFIFPYLRNFCNISTTEVSLYFSLWSFAGVIFPTQKNVSERSYFKPRQDSEFASNWSESIFAGCGRIEIIIFAWKMATLQKFLSNLNMGIIGVPDVYTILVPKNPHLFACSIIYFWNYENFWKYCRAWLWYLVFSRKSDYVLSSLFLCWLQKLQHSIYCRNFWDMEKRRSLSVG